jgi:hypothetical protein
MKWDENSNFENRSRSGFQKVAIPTICSVVALLLMSCAAMRTRSISPIITSVTPEDLDPGGRSVTLTIRGLGFQESEGCSGTSIDLLVWPCNIELICHENFA